jgi:hypothetical protein
MRTILASLLALSMIAGGCSRTVATGPDGARVDQNADGTMTYKDNKGNEVNYNNKGGFEGVNEKGEKFAMGQSEVSEAELGLKLYPGSTATNADMKAESGGKKTFVSMRTTTDDPSKVADFYKGLVKEPQTATMNDMATVSGKLEDGREVGITCAKADGKTTITVTVVQK